MIHLSEGGTYYDMCVKTGANRSNMSYNMLYTMLKVECWDGLNMITRYNMLESSKMSYNIFERVRKC